MSDSDGSRSASVSQERDESDDKECWSEEGSSDDSDSSEYSLNMLLDARRFMNQGLTSHPCVRIFGRVTKIFPPYAKPSLII